MAAAQSATAQLLEVFGFLSDPQTPVRRIALATLLYVHLFIRVVRHRLR